MVCGLRRRSEGSSRRTGRLEKGSVGLDDEENGLRETQ